MKRLKRKHLLLLANKLIKKIFDRRNAKEQYESFLIKKSRKSTKQLEIINSQAKTFENSSIVDIESIITEHGKTSHKLSNNIRQPEKRS